MAGGVYSTRLINTGGSASAIYYAVPQGKRLVVKCITAYNAASNQSNISLHVAGSWVWNVTVPGTQGIFQSGLMLVVNAGEQFGMAAASPSVAYHASGYLLDTG